MFNAPGARLGNVDRFWTQGIELSMHIGCFKRLARFFIQKHQALKHVNPILLRGALEGALKDNLAALKFLVRETPQPVLVSSTDISPAFIREAFNQAEDSFTQWLGFLR